MNRQLQNEAMARIEGIRIQPKPSPYIPDPLLGVGQRLPDYDDLNVLHRIVRNMRLDIHGKFLDEIKRIRDRDFAPEWMEETPQIREAILRAYGKWEQDND